MGIGLLQIAHGHHLLMDEFFVGGDDAVDKLRVRLGLRWGFERRCFRLSYGRVLLRFCLLQHHSINYYNITIENTIPPSLTHDQP
jgi:hypothetical protein